MTLLFWIVLIGVYIVSFFMAYLMTRMGAKYNRFFLDDTNTGTFIFWIVMPGLNTVYWMLGIPFVLEWRNEELSSQPKQVSPWFKKLLGLGDDAD